MSHIKRSLASKLAKGGKVLVKPILNMGSKDNMTFLQFVPLTVGALTRKEKSNIDCLRLTACNSGAVSLSGNQLGYSTQYFIIHKNLRQNKWKIENAQPYEYELYVNPRIIQYSKDETNKQFEYCPSLPNIRGYIQRYNNIKIKYFNEHFKEEICELNGFPARVFQHELDHLKGRTLLSWRVSEGDIEILPGQEIEFPNLAEAISKHKATLNSLKNNKPEYFNLDKTLNELNPLNEDFNLNYYDRNNTHDYQQPWAEYERDFITTLQDALERDVFLIKQKFMKEIQSGINTKKGDL